MYKVGDIAYPLIGKFQGMKGTVIEVEDRENGSITIEFKDGANGLYFKNELRKGS